MAKFDLLIAQKKGAAHVSNATDKLIGVLVVVLLVSVLAGTIFGYLGTGATGLGNTTLNPGVPTWLPTVLIVLVAVGILYLVIRATGIGK